MAVLSYNEIVRGSVISYNNEPYEVLSSHVFRMQANPPQNKAKLRHLVSGKVIDTTFHQSATVEEADIETMMARYLYTNRGESWFAEEGNLKNRFSFPEGAVHEKVQWLAQNALIEVVTYEEKPITIRIPVKVDLVVKEAPPAVKGNTATGGTKIITLSTGATVDAPMFINPGDVVRINTETGEYTERVSKA
jgi:elongation factor P